MQQNRHHWVFHCKVLQGVVIQKHCRLPPLVTTTVWFQTLLLNVVTYERTRFTYELSKNIDK